MNSRATQGTKSPFGDSPLRQDILRRGWEPAHAGLALCVARGFNRRAETQNLRRWIICKAGVSVAQGLATHPDFS